MDGDLQPAQPRIQQNPHLAECPDFDDGTFDDLIESMIGPDRTREQAVKGLKAAWHTQNNRRKALWDAQILADQRAGNEPNAQEGAHGEQPRTHDDTEANRRSPKLGGFAPNTSIGNEIAINKLRDMKYSTSNCTASLPRVAATTPTRAHPRWY